MTAPLIRQAELDFWLWDWLGLDRLLELEPYAGHDRETIEAVLALSAELAEDLFLPHYKLADSNEPKLESGNVRVLPALAEALRSYAALGMFGAGFASALGGMQLPGLVAAASMAQFMAANIATSGYVMLTVANARLIATFGTSAQIDTFARPQIAGEKFGTMCLSEPQAGSSLADISTRAEREGDDELGRRYRLFGNKMWISGGDQDITHDIIHLVLAKVPGPDGQLPFGTKGISLFIVPKWLPGTVERNDIVVAGLNHKMGYRGTANCLINLGEGRHLPGNRAGAVGYLVGSEGEGLTQMFQMMNEARINVGLGAAAIAYRGYRLSVEYARDRLQGRPLALAKGVAVKPIALIEHPDVKAMLLAQRVYAEGALALVLYCARLSDLESIDADAAELLALLTPVAKTWPSEWGLVANDLAIQVHGGYGYTRDFDVEQLYRDNRLNPIHEGATGIQALDLLGRKLLRGSGLALDLFGSRVAETCDRSLPFPGLAGFAAALCVTMDRMRQTLAALATCAEPGRNLANATPFLRGFGHLVVGWLWLDQTVRLEEMARNDDFARGKLRACRFFFEAELPKTTAWFAFVESMTDVAAEALSHEF